MPQFSLIDQVDVDPFPPVPARTVPVLFIGVTGVVPDELVPVEVSPVEVAPVEIADPLEVSEFCDPVEVTGRSGSKTIPPVFVSIAPVCVDQVCTEPVCTTQV